MIRNDKKAITHITCSFPEETCSHNPKINNYDNYDNYENYENYESFKNFKNFNNYKNYKNYKNEDEKRDRNLDNSRKWNEIYEKDWEIWSSDEEKNDNSLRSKFLCAVKRAKTVSADDSVDNDKNQKEFIEKFAEMSLKPKEIQVPTQELSALSINTFVCPFCGHEFALRRTRDKHKNRCTEKK